MARPAFGKTQKKILLFLLGTAAFGLARNPKKQVRVIRGFSRAVREIDRTGSLRSALALEERGYVSLRRTKDGERYVQLTKKGAREARRCALEHIQPPAKQKWDGWWRIVMFDVPEKERGKRNDLRGVLHQLNFLEIQKSVFASPYDCFAQVNEATQILGAEKYIRFIVTKHLEPNHDAKKHFRLC